MVVHDDVDIAAVRSAAVDLPQKTESPFCKLPNDVIVLQSRSGEEEGAEHASWNLWASLKHDDEA